MKNKRFERKNFRRKNNGEDSMKKSNSSRKLILIIFVLALFIFVGFILFFYASLTGKISLQWEPPVGDEFDIPEFSPVPDKPSGNENPVSLLTECDEAKIIRSFACEVYSTKYPNGCGFWPNNCKGMREMCVLAQEKFEKDCSA